MQYSRSPVQWSFGVLGGCLLGLLTSLGLGGPPRSTAYAPGSQFPSTSGGILLQDGRLTARLHGVPLRQVMAQVSQQSSVQVRWLDPDLGAQKVTAVFTDLPLPEALRRILRGTNFVLFYTSDGEGSRLTQIWVASRREVEGPSAHTEEPAEGIAQPDEAVLQPPLSAEELVLSLAALEQLGRRAEENTKASGLLDEASAIE